jgi:hypothetical protein
VWFPAQEAEMSTQHITGNGSPVAGEIAEWLCSYQTNIPPQATEWCVPGCLTILSQRLFGKQYDAKYFAGQWHQPPGAPVDAYLTDFRQFCLGSGMTMLVDPLKGPEDKDWSWMTELRKPTVIALVNHAFVCIGTCSKILTDTGCCKPGYRVLDPAEPTRPRNWLVFPPGNVLRVMFAFSAPGNDCPRNVTLDNQSLAVA